MKYRAKHLIEYALLRILAGTLRILPYKIALFLAWLNALQAFYLFHSRVREAESRIKEVFGNRFNDRQARDISWISWRNMAFIFIEMTRTPKLTMKWFRKYANFDSVIEKLKTHTDAGQAGILAVAHMGNWEIGTAALCIHGIPLFSIAAKQRNPLANEYINRLRSHHGMQILTRGQGTMKQVMRNLASGMLLGILPDVRVSTGGIKIQFLDKEANIGSGMARFARHANVPIFPCVVTRRGWARLESKLYDPVYPDGNTPKAQDEERMTKEVLKCFENAIRAEPEQWFWFNKRWILEPIEPGNASIHS
ncbi:MAG: lysophospholipid acyltransferase family protein [Lentisphaerae bacterium]|nr:lysophospholipid acyltransferase family protein [Lentisphaerota bacterium]